MKLASGKHLRIGWQVVSLNPPELSAALLIKATYRLVPGGAAVPADEPEFPTGDTPPPDGHPDLIHYPCDVVPLKPRPELIVVGACHAPDGKPAPACRVSIALGSVKKALIVVGDREWRRTRAGIQEPTEPKLFTTMPIDYSRSFGGEGFARNPLGRGRGREILEDGREVHRLPNIEDPNRLVTSPNGEFEPAGFAPVPATWPQRMGKIGPVSGDYLKKRWPWFPEDFDFNYFNCVPPDQRFAAPLQGDEAYRFENLHPEISGLEGKLPAERAQLFVRLAEPPAPPDAAAGPQPPPAPGPLLEVPLSIDTIWVQPDALKLILVWRGLLKTRDIKLRDVGEMHAVETPLSAPAWTAESYQRHLEQNAAELEEADAAAEAEAAAKAEAEKAEEEREEAATLKIETDALRETLEKELAADAERARLGLPAVEPAPLPIAETVKQAAGLLSKLKSDAASGAAALPPGLLDLPDDLLEGLGEDIEADDAEWTRAGVEQALANGNSLAGAVLAGLDLSGLVFDGLDLAGTVFQGCSLVGSAFRGACLDRALLAGADLHDADLSGASMEEADLTGARLEGARLEAVQISRALFLGVSAARALFDGARGRSADFASAVLTQALFRGARLESVSFREADLSDADLTGASLPNCTLEKAVAPRMCLAHAEIPGCRATGALDLTEVDFSDVKAAGAIFNRACLDRSRFGSARLTRASFSGASLQGALFDGARLTNASFEEARISGCSFIGVDLFRGSFERARIQVADFRYANLYEVEFWQSEQVDVRYESTNLKMTKLAGR